ncbi:MAG: sensor histidine kinase [Pseudomonadota bacterium]
MSVPADPTIWRLQERVKELTALHGTARILQEDALDPREVLRRVLALLPPAWQYPEITEARLAFGELVVATPCWSETPWTQRATYRTTEGEEGEVAVAYTEARPPMAEGVFLAEERALIDSLAQMLRRWFQQRAADRALEAVHRDLERRVADRTEDLSRANASLQREVDEHRAARAALEQSQWQLRQMANALCLAGERERRGIAQALHDHVGQSLAFARMRLADIQGNAVFCGFEDELAQVARLLDGCLRYTRDLTGELSPPRLYTLGLDAALAWLAENWRTHHRQEVTYRGCDSLRDLPEQDRVLLYVAARELLANAVRHAGPCQVAMSLEQPPGRAALVVRDDGRGFDEGAVSPGSFGLFSLRERLRTREGTLQLRSAPGAGTEVRVEIPFAAKDPR